MHWLINGKDEKFLSITVTIEPDISPIATVIKNYNTSYENNTLQLSILLTVLNKLRIYQVIWSRKTQSITAQTFPIRFQSLRTADRAKLQRWDQF